MRKSKRVIDAEPENQTREELHEKPKTGGYSRFKHELDWIYLAFSVKELREQVRYLMGKDDDFVAAAKTKPILSNYLIESKISTLISKPKKQPRNTPELRSIVPEQPYSVPENVEASADPPPEQPIHKEVTLSSHFSNLRKKRQQRVFPSSRYEVDSEQSFEKVL